MVELFVGEERFSCSSRMSGCSTEQYMMPCPVRISSTCSTSMSQDGEGDTRGVFDTLGPVVESLVREAPFACS